jgi:hypothetical protein
MIPSAKSAFQLWLPRRLKRTLPDTSGTMRVILFAFISFAKMHLLIADSLMTPNTRKLQARKHPFSRVFN